MKQILTHVELGMNILIVLDECPACLDMLQTVVSCLPDIPKKHITLLYCCSILPHDLDNDLMVEEREFQLEQQYLYQATDILYAAGVPHKHISVARAIGKECLISAIIAELKRKPYTGLIIREYYHQLAHQLQRRGLMDEFGQIGDVAVWVMPANTVLPAHVF